MPRVAFLQMDCVEGEPETNRARVQEAIAEAIRGGAALVALPELWCSGYDLKSAVAQGGWSEDFGWLADLSQDIGILGGSLLEAADGRYRNCGVACAGGQIRARYRKQHLFRPLDEATWLDPGPQRSHVFPLAGLQCAMAICYDLRFPEVFRPLALAGAELIHVPAQWPGARVGHWRALLVARAIECQCYVLGVNRRGFFGDLEFPGHSLLIDPQGEIVIDADDQPGVYFAEVDPMVVQDWRRDFPTLADRREDLYPSS